MDSIEQLFPDNLKFLYKILFFPVSWLIWSMQDGGYVLFLKILFLALPLLFICVATFCTIVSLITLIFRPNRTFYVGTILITWWDGGKSCFLYWAGIFRFLFLSVGWIVGGIRVIILGFFQTIKDVIFLPMTILTRALRGYAEPGIPWVAVFFTFFWIMLEALTFSFVLRPLVSEVLLNLTNQEFPDIVIISGAFIFLFMVIGGSFACMHGLVLALDKKQMVTVIKMILIEMSIMVIEVLFFYREFVDALSPWLAQMTNDSLQLGIFQVLGIAIFAWLGVRSSTWFFFAKYGTPTLLTIISRKGIKKDKGSDKSDGPVSNNAPLSWIKEISLQVQEQVDWFSLKGKEITEAFVLPPVQVLAVMTNFCMVLLTGKNLFNLPIKTLNELKDTRDMLEQIAKEGR